MTACKSNVLTSNRSLNKIVPRLEMFFIGVDGGGSTAAFFFRFLLLFNCLIAKTRAILIDEMRNVLATSETASSNPNSVGADVARSNMTTCIANLLKHIPIEQVSKICCGISGCDTPTNEITCLLNFVSVSSPVHVTIYPLFRCKLDF